MNIVTWNCNRGKFVNNAPLLDSLAPDIAVIQECARPPEESESCLWFGDNPNQGIAIQSANGFTIARILEIEDVPKFFIPIAVSGPIEFILFAVWSKNDQTHMYIRGIVKAVE